MKIFFALIILLSVANCKDQKDRYKLKQVASNRFHKNNLDVCQVRLNQHIEIFDQTGSNMCSAFAVAQTISSIYSENISPTWLAIKSGNLGHNLPQNVMRVVNDQTFLCKANASLEPKAHQLVQFCADYSTLHAQLKRKVVPIISFDKDSPFYQTLARTYKTPGVDQIKKMYTESLSSMFQTKMSELIQRTFSGFIESRYLNVDSLKSMLQKQETNLLKGHPLPYSDCIAILDLAYQNFFSYHKIKNTTKLQLFAVKDFSQCESKIEESLKKSIPPIIGLNFSVIYNSEINNRGEGHYLNIVGKICEDDKDFYLIRNSYGRSCQNHRKNGKLIDWPCEAGEFKMPVKKVCQNIGKLYAP